LGLIIQTVILLPAKEMAYASAILPPPLSTIFRRLVDRERENVTAEHLEILLRSFYPDDNPDKDEKVMERIKWLNGTLDGCTMIPSYKDICAARLVYLNLFEEYENAASATGDGPDIAVALYGPIFREALVAVGYKFAEKELDRIDALRGERFFTMLIRRTINAVKMKKEQEAGVRAKTQSVA
jgi:hypothetical protein